SQSRPVGRGKIGNERSGRIESISREARIGLGDGYRPLRIYGWRGILQATIQSRAEEYVENAELHAAAAYGVGVAPQILTRDEIGQVRGLEVDRCRIARRAEAESRCGHQKSRRKTSDA